MSTEPTKIIFGLRHKRLFGVINHLGEIADVLTPLQGTGVFPLECFSKIGWTADRSALSLRDEDSTFIIDVDVDGFIFTCDLEAEPKITLEEACQAFKEMADKILSITKAGPAMNRLGIVEEYEIQPFKNSAKKIADELLNIGLEGIHDSCVFRMSLKKTTLEGWSKGDTDDYRNVIIQFAAKRSDEKRKGPPDLIKVSLDFQHYYDPERTFSPKLVDGHFKFFKEESKKDRKTT